MRFPPVVPADVAFDADGTPRIPGCGHLHHTQAGALERAGEVFLAGNGLPQRWRGRERFVILELGFGLGHNFLATWLAWRQDPQRPQRLHVVSVEPHPVAQSAARRAFERHAGTPVHELAQALLQVWPSASPDLFQASFDDARVVLQVVHAPEALALRELRLQADALYLDKLCPQCHAQDQGHEHEHGSAPPIFKALARLAAPGCTAASESSASLLHAGLRQAGFEPANTADPAGQRSFTRAHQVRRLPPPRHAGTTPPWKKGDAPVVIIGAGLAGAACAAALSAAQVPCVVLDAQAQPAQGASGNPAGLVHGVLHPEDGAHARLGRAAAWMAQRTYAPLVAQGMLPGRIEGLLRRETRLDATAMRALIARLGLPADYVQVRDALSGDALPGAALPPLTFPAWFYPGGGWIEPGAWVRHALRQPGVHFRGNSPVAALERKGSTWQVLDHRGSVLARSHHLVLCSSADILPLLPAHVTEAWPVGRQRGQITRIPMGNGSWPGLPLPHPISGGGYALSLPDGDLLCGATATQDDDEASLRADDHRLNLERARRLISTMTGTLTGTLIGPLIDPLLDTDLHTLGGRVGWRFHADDRLPLVGPVQAWNNEALLDLQRPNSMQASPDQANPMRPTRPPSRLREVSAEPGLYAVTGLGSRGITWAPLVGATLASWVTGDPWPLPGSLVDAMDPRRFALKRSRTARPGPYPAGR